MIDARKVANKIEEPRAKAIAYHDTVAACFDEIRRHIDKLEEIVDDQIWPLPKYRELLFPPLILCDKPLSAVIF